LQEKVEHVEEYIEETKQQDLIINFKDFGLDAQWTQLLKNGLRDSTLDLQQ